MLDFSQSKRIFLIPYCQTVLSSRYGGFSLCGINGPFFYGSQNKGTSAKRSLLCPLLQFAMLKSFLFVYGIDSQSQTHTLAEHPLLIVSFHGLFKHWQAFPNFLCGYAPTKTCLLKEILGLFHEVTLWRVKKMPWNFFFLEPFSAF